VEQCLIKTSGAWYSLGEISLSQGCGAACVYLAEQGELCEQLAREILKPPQPAAAAAAAA